MFVGGGLAVLWLHSLSAAANSAEEDLRDMKVAHGFAVKLVASEPEIRQPLSISFDERGRMWVIQYLQYPAPAGLKPVKVDQFLRTTYDRLPEPPPRGPKGADRITICEDTDGDGRMDKFKDFVGGLNLCSGMAIGYGGVFVVQPPYLLFYADKNRDDIPDGDPEVLLTGFGMEDAHAFANSLTWGPDGWLYGAQGSTVTAHIRGIEFQQGIWRYHPLTRAFELFAEGGGNTWGLDFDDEGEILAGTNYYEKMLHMVQGGFYIKRFGKHGELHNPHAYGYFDHVPYSGYKGSHISIGGIVYHGGALGTNLAGNYIFADTIDHSVLWAKLQPQGSSFTASFGGALLKTTNELFRPVDCETGPDGAVYIADWCDKRATHVDPLDTWDRSNGRIYKIQSSPETSRPSAFCDLAKLSTDHVVDLLASTNDWFVRAARRLLAERRAPKVLPRLRKQLFGSHNEHLELESLWALYVSGGFDDALAEKCLQHPHAAIRKWTVRFLGDPPLTLPRSSLSLSQEDRAGERSPLTLRALSPQHLRQLVLLAKTETNAPVLSQLACSAKRLKGSDSLPILGELLLRSAESDPQIPLLLWWALESKTISDRAEVLKVFSSPEIRKAPLVRRHILERLGRRYAEEGQAEDFAACATLLDLADANELKPLLTGIENGLRGRTFKAPPGPLKSWFDKAWSPEQPGLLLISFGLRLGDPRAKKSALGFVSDDAQPEPDRISLIEIFAETGQAEIVPTLLAICGKSKSQELKSAALTSLRRFPDLSVGERVLDLFKTFGPELRPRVTDMLSSRHTWAELLLRGVEDGKVKTSEVSGGRVQHMVSFQDPALTRRIEKLWGKVQTESPAEKRNSINRLKLVLKPSGVAGRDAKGNAIEGKKLFQQTCAICHKLFGEGNTIGPDLTGIDRKDTDSMLANIVDPSAYIRPEYISYELQTTDDQAITGLLVESTPTAVTLLDRNNQRHTLSRDQVKELKESQLSLMPDGLLESLPPQQLMDLFSYLQKD
jgi:putative membrane-bound dehydrogenase-like protein